MLAMSLGLARAGITAEGTQFPDWSTIGAEFLIKGGFQTEGRQLTTEFRLFDVLKGEMVVGKRYVGIPEDRGRMVGQFANEVVRALTGEDGLFDTRIARATTTRLSLRATTPIPVYMDGEYCGVHTSVDVQVLPGALRLL